MERAILRGWARHERTGGRLQGEDVERAFTQLHIPWKASQRSRSPTDEIHEDLASLRGTERT